MLKALVDFKYLNNQLQNWLKSKNLIVLSKYIAKFSASDQTICWLP